MAFAKHCDKSATGLAQRADRADGGGRRQAADHSARDPAQRRNGEKAHPGEDVPARSAERGPPRVALRRKRGAQEDEIDANARRAHECGAIVCGGCQETTSVNLGRASRRAKMKARAETRGEIGIPRDHEQGPSRATEARDAPRQQGTVRDAIVAENDARQTLRQARDRGAGVGKPARIGEEPERRQSRSSPRLDRPRPSDEPLVHGRTG